MTAEVTIKPEPRLKYTRTGALLGMLASGWGCLIGLGVKAAGGTDPAPPLTPPQVTEQGVEYAGEAQAPNKDGILYIIVTVGGAALGGAAGRLGDAVSAHKG